MTISADTDTLIARFIAQWTAVNPTVPIYFDNQTFDEPNNTWVRVSVVPQKVERQSFTSTTTRYLYPGRVFVQIFTLAGRGTGDITKLADDVVDIFRTWVKDGTFRTLEPSIDKVGAVIGEKFYQWNVSFVYESTKYF